MRRIKRKHIIEPVIHLAFWLGVYYALSSLRAASFNMVVYNNGMPTGGYNGHTLFPCPQYVLVALMVMFYGNIFWLFKKFIRRKSYLRGVAAIAGWVALLFVFNYMAVNSFAKPPRSRPYHSDSTSVSPAPKVTFSFDTLAHASPGNTRDSLKIIRQPPPRPPEMAFTGDNWRDMQLVMAIVFLSILGIAAAYFFITEWVRNDLARSQAEAHQYSTEVRFLRSQVNPHFLFNTLNNLFSMAQRNGDEDVAEGIYKLSGMMRYMIYESNTESVPLQKEIEYLEDCIALNKLRYAGDEATVSFSYPEPNAIAMVQVAPMLFIPFLENAFKHGVLIGRNSDIAMALSVNQKKLTFTCGNTDYTAVKKLQEEKTGIGLENVQRRLQLVYPGRHMLQYGGRRKIYSNP